MILLMFSTFFGCARIVRTEYQRPEFVLPEKWQTQPDTGEQVLASSKWWEVFEDSDLNALIEKALQANNNLAAATIKVHKARLQAELSVAKLKPDISVSVNADAQKDFDRGDSTQSSSASINLSYELDLWGKLAASLDAVDWEAKATEQDRANTALSLVGTTADLYWQIAYLNQAISNGREGIAYTQKTLELVQVRYRAGAISKLDLIQTEQDVESQKSELADMEACGLITNYLKYSISSAIQFPIQNT